MTFIGDLLAAIAALPRPLLVVATGLLVLGECTIGLGFVVPGEAGLLIASASVTDFWFFLALSLTVAVCAFLGDTIGFWLGRRYGLRMRESKAVRKVGQQHWDRAGRLLRRYGIWAVLAARFLPVVRTLTPAAAGTSGLGYGRFLAASLVGATAWSTMHVGIGWLAGASAKLVEETLGRATWILVGAIVLVGVAAWLWRRSRRGRAEGVDASTPAEVEADVERAA